MNDHEILTAITVALGEVLQRDLDGVTEDTRLFDDLNLDSTTIIELLMALEDALGILVDPDTLEPEHFTTIGSLAEYVRAAQPAQAVH
jgi:acyl carrier protein